jgi:hypothetical protein
VHVPFLLYKFKIFEDDFLHLSFILIVHTVTICFLNVKILSVQPIFTFLFGFSTMDVDRLVLLVRIEEKPPTHNQQNGRHKTALPDYKFH